ncbi:hypothetical protein [Streptomyces sp. NPDC059761]|uniref:hypothetical protein n=1 Tax=Streptomyces sp. NPDC059761 TaxID=3346937 RepID=UPI0036494638
MPNRKTASPPTFRTPVWPERACRDLVNGEYATHSCDVVEGHLGPHASMSVPQSVAQRAAWEKRNPDKLEPTAASDPYYTG